MARKTLAVLLVTLLVGSLGLSACSSGPKEIIIGEIAALTGPTALSGTQERNGVQMAIDEINAKGGLLGKQLKLVTLDFKGQVEDGVAAYKRLVEQNKAVAIIGTNFSNVNIAISPEADRLQVPVVCNAMDTRATTKPDGKTYAYTFLAQPSSIAQGKMIAKMAMEELGATRAAVLVNNGLAFATSLADPFKEYFVAHGGTIVADEQFPPEQVDFRAQLTKIKAANPDVIMIPQYAQQSGLAIKQARELQINVPVVGPNTLSGPDFVNSTGAENMNDIYYIYNVNIKDDFFANFRARYEAKYKEEIKTTNVLFGYDNVQIIAAAILKANSLDPKKIRDAIEQTTDVAIMQGGGKITIDRDIHRPHNMPIEMFRWVNAEPVHFGTVVLNERD